MLLGPRHVARLAFVCPAQLRANDAFAGLRSTSKARIAETLRERLFRFLAAGNAVDGAVKTQRDGFANLRVHIDRNAIQHQRVPRATLKPGLHFSQVAGNVCFGVHRNRLGVHGLDGA